MEIMKANRQWSTRPEDQKFSSLQQLYDVTKGHYQHAVEKLVPFADLQVAAIDNDVQLVGKAGIPAKLTNWAFGQLCSKVQAPASYLRELPAELAAKNLNHGLIKRVADGTCNAVANLLFDRSSALTMRSICTEEYARIWNYEVCQRLLDLESRGWYPAGVDIRAKADNSSAESLDLYASDHDMFAFLCNTNLTVEERGSDGAVYKGLIAENSEVGAGALWLTEFLYREKCGNHIIWNASRLVEIGVRHIGNARERWANYAAVIRKYAEGSATETEAKIAKAKTAVIGASKDEVLDALFGKRSLNLSRKTLELGYDATVEAEDGSPRTQWGLVQGLTRYSQTIPYADKRAEVDRAAGRVMELTF